MSEQVSELGAAGERPDRGAAGAPGPARPAGSAGGRDRTPPDTGDAPVPADGAVAGRVRELQGRLGFESRLRRALAAVAEAEEGLDVARRAAEQLVDRGTVDVRLSRQDRSGPRPQPAGPQGDVEVSDCSALRLGATVVARSTTDFDACAHLRSLDHPGTAVCIPMVALGRPVAVIFWTGSEGDVLDPAGIQALEVVAEIAAPYLGLLRASGIRPPESVDPLTGLLNHRSIELRIRELVRDLVPFSIALCDLDHLEQLVAHHGHESGERALRRMGEVLRATVRPGDVVGRVGGDEFLVVFPSCSTLDAAAAVERVRESLALSLAAGGVPAFTASFGVADSNADETIEGIVGAAEGALHRAKEQGRNRVVVAGA